MNTEMDATPPKECHPDCGKPVQDYVKSGNRSMTELGFRAAGTSETAYCSPVCRDGRLPPIASPSSKIEVKTTVDGKCPLCGVAVPSTHIHLCSQPRHIERRKGQRWLNSNGHHATEFVLLERLPDWGDMETWMSTAGRKWFFGAIELRSMTLLTDAPAEPGKPERVSEPLARAEALTGSSKPCFKCGDVLLCRCFKKAPPAHEAPKAMDCKATNPIDCGGCPEHAPWAAREIGAGCCDVSDAGYACNCIPTKLVRTRMQEAPKAAPVCCVRDKGHVCGGPVLKRVIGPRYATVTEFCCDVGMQNFEKAAASAGFKQTGTPYKGPERLSSVLARDEMVEADWLPEAGR